MLKKISIFLFLGFFSFSSFAQTECGEGMYERINMHLTFHKVVDLKFTSTYTSLFGELCVGVKDNKIVAIVYRDTQEKEVATRKSSYQKKDIPVIKHSHLSFPARFVTRSSDPLTLKIRESFERKNHSVYITSAKILVNFLKTAAPDDLRLLNLRFEVERNIPKIYFQNEEIDEMEFSVSPLLQTTSVSLRRNTHNLKKLKVKELGETKRNL